MQVNGQIECKLMNYSYLKSVTAHLNLSAPKTQPAYVNRCLECQKTKQMQCWKVTDNNLVQDSNSL